MTQKWRGKRGLSPALLRSLKVVGDSSPFSCLRPSAQSSSPRLPSPRGASDQNTHTWPLPGASWLRHSWCEHREEQAEACHAFCDLVLEIVQHQFCPSHRPSQSQGEGAYTPPLDGRSVNMASQQKHVWQGPSGGHPGEYHRPCLPIFSFSVEAVTPHPASRARYKTTLFPSFSPPHPVHQIRRFCRPSPVHLHISDSPLLFTP